MYQQTVALNNRGVALLEGGDLHQSYGLFRDTLRNTMAMLRRAAAGAPQENSGVWVNPSAACAGANVPMQHPAKAALTQFVFSQGICLVGTPGAYSTDCLIDLSITSSIVLFNLAVVHHLKGTKENVPRYLVKAESFYEKAYALLEDTGLTLGGTGNPLIDFLAMALKNNAAQAARELCRFEVSRSCFQELIQLALQVDTSRYTDAHVVQFIEEAKTMFMLNAIVLSEPTLAAAA